MVGITGEVATKLLASAPLGNVHLICFLFLLLIYVCLELFATQAPGESTNVITTIVDDGDDDGDRPPFEADPSPPITFEETEGLFLLVSFVFITLINLLNDSYRGDEPWQRQVGGTIVIQGYVDGTHPHYHRSLRLW
jgi:hypothetical protein